MSTITSVHYASPRPEEAPPCECPAVISLQDEIIHPRRSGQSLWGKVQRHANDKSMLTERNRNLSGLNETEVRPLQANRLLDALKRCRNVLHLHFLSWKHQNMGKLIYQTKLLYWQNNEKNATAFYTLVCNKVMTKRSFVFSCEDRIYNALHLHNIISVTLINLQHRKEHILNIKGMKKKQKTEEFFLRYGGKRKCVGCIVVFNIPHSSQQNAVVLLPDSTSMIILHSRAVCIFLKESPLKWRCFPHIFMCHICFP